MADITNYLYPEYMTKNLAGTQLESVNRLNNFIKKCFKHQGRVFKWANGSYMVVTPDGELVEFNRNDEATGGTVWVASEANNKWYWTYKTKKEAVEAILGK